MTAMKQVQLRQGPVAYRDMGNGETIVLVHGLLVNGELWRDLAPRLAQDFRVIVPELPLGSNELPLARGSDVTPPALAALIAELLVALDLDGVTLVGNDTGGALCQIVAAEHSQRVARLVLTPCDAYEHFPPPAFKPLVEAAKLPGAMTAILQGMRTSAARRLPQAYGNLMVHFDDELTASWVAPALKNPLVRAQARETLTSFDKRYTLAAAERFGAFEKPVLIAWADDDRFFPLADAERLARDFPNARLEVIENARTFIPLDQPQRLAELIAAFAREPLPEGAAQARA
jgi:pimeloyl-ACP methyl ester carboxylesterase